MNDFCAFSGKTGLKRLDLLQTSIAKSIGRVTQYYRTCNGLFLPSVSSRVAGTITRSVSQFVCIAGLIFTSISHNC